MDAKAWRECAVVVVCAAMLAGCASGPARADAPAQSSRAATPAASASAAARTPVSERPSDPEAAFIDGYRAYLAHDNARASERLKFAADNFPALGDYALYYLALAQNSQGDLAGSVDTLERLTKTYPESVTIGQAELILGQNLVKMGRTLEAIAVAARVLARHPEPSIEQGARIVEARAWIALGKPHPAYAQMMELRDRYPRSDADAEARSIVNAIILSNRDVVDTSLLGYHREEAALLLREGELAEADEQAEAGLAMAPEESARAELVWVQARALKPEPERAKRAILEYLQIAPRGPDAAAALEALALIYWHDDDYAHAREAFGRIAAELPGNERAPGAMMRIGKIFEDEHKLDSARAEYRKLAARYPNSEAAAEARFRGPWTLYLAHQYRAAAPGFMSARGHAKEATERDMCDYWRARALEKAGDGADARAIFAKLAESIDSNYYPELASRRVAAASPATAASSAADPMFNGTPAVTGAAEYHMARLNTLRAMGLKELQPNELKSLEEAGNDSREMRRFILAGFASADAWYDAIEAATRMEKIGQLDHATAERVRYPRAYWELFNSASSRLGLDPYLVIALARQESLFNPKATSVSNARGLMQLIPSTAKKVAAERGMAPGAIELYDPSINVDLGTTYLKSLFEMFKGDAFHAVAAYNGGEHAVAKWMAEFPGDDDEWVENIAYKETREYVKKVIGGRREYRLLYVAARSPEPNP